MDWKNKVAVITGAGGVLCGEIAKEYAAAGAKVALLDINLAAAQKVADEIKNAGGVAVSGLEMAQNSARMTWSREKVDQELRNIMNNIYKNISEAAEKYSEKNNFVDGANIAGFMKVSRAMLAEGYV